MVYVKDFVGWYPVKSKLNDRKPHYFKHREIWWCSTGVNIGAEQDGKNDKFERPVLIVRKFSNRLFLAVPLTTNLAETNNKIIEYVLIKKTQKSVKRAFLINQMRVLDVARMHRKMGRVNKAVFDKIKMQICACLKDGQ